MSDMSALEDIAIVAMACRFPGADTPEAFWENLRAGVESIAPAPEADLHAHGVDPALRDRPDWVDAGGRLENLAAFDAAFFGLTPREAEAIDPQQRVFLEIVWEVLERAGYSLERQDRAIGLFGGSGVNTYFLKNLLPNRDVWDTLGPDRLRIANRPDNLATRTAYHLNLHGPVVTVQTGCSTSLVAVHFACQSLLNGECDLAIAGGVSISETAQTGYLYREGSILSPDGHCRAFDAAAKGTVNGNGVGVILLKRLSAAIQEGDPILAVVKGSAIGNDGSDKIGYTAPSQRGQARVIREALAIAGVEPDAISYVEAHGTGTPLGDPIEVAALTEAFRSQTARTGYCAIGSVKTNIGHLDTAAGIAGLIKTVLALQHRQIPPTLHYRTPNPQIDFDHSPFYPNDRLVDWCPPAGHLRLAGVSSFGIGGTNAHVVLSEFPLLQTDRNSTVPPVEQLYLLSAKTPIALERTTQNLLHHLDTHPDLDSAAIAQTLQQGRTRFPYRRAIVAGDYASLRAQLSRYNAQDLSDHPQEQQHRPVAFLFPGQGSQYRGMGQGLYESEPCFRHWLDRGADLLQPLLGFDIRDRLYASDASAEDDLQKTAIAQPILFTVEYALARLWMSWGIQPVALLGHSLGEYVAACVAGLWSFSDALAIAVQRGKLMQTCPPGAMVAVPLAEKALQQRLEAPLSLAAINAPSLCVVSGPEAAITAFQAQLTEEGIGTRRLKTSHAFHSPMMASAVTPFAEFLATVPVQSTNCRWISNTTGVWIDGQTAADPHYWAAQLCQPVRFADGVATLLATDAALLEVGPGRTLSTLVRQQASPEITILSCLRHPQETIRDRSFILQTLGQLWVDGVDLDWQAIASSHPQRRIPLPTYPFERQSYWIDPPQTASDRATPPASSASIENQNHRLPPSDWLRAPTWQQAPLPYSPSPMPPTGWLCFCDEENGLGVQAAQLLAARGQQVIRVVPSQSFQRRDEETYGLNPRKAEDYLALMAHLIRDHVFPGAIVHAWVGDDEGGGEPLALPLGFESLLYLAQALGGQALAAPLPIFALVPTLHNITGRERIVPEHATVWGACMVIAQEYPDLRCHLIDCDWPLGVDASLQTELLWRELAQGITTCLDRRAGRIAFRGGHRWVPGTPAQIASPSPERSLPVKSEGVYLLTGGLGGMGLTFARHLAETNVSPQLVLAGRTPLPPRNTWTDWIAQADSTDPKRQAIQAIQSLESLGAKVMIATVDVADLAAMQHLKTRIETELGPVRGIFHAAGVAGGGALQVMTSNDARAVFAPKLCGTRILETLWGDDLLDFWILCSSLSGTVGGAGQADYAAANAFMDSFAQMRWIQGDRSIRCIDWCTWQQVGMAANTQVPTALAARRADRLAAGLSPTEGLTVLEAVWATGLPQVLVSTADLSQRQTQAVIPIPLPTEPVTSRDTASHSATPHTYPRPNLATDYIAPRSDLERRLVALWESLLGIQNPGVDDNFFDLGGHSLLASQVTAHLRQQFSIAVPLSFLFERPTIAALAEGIEALVLADIEAMSDTDVEQMIHHG